jgi:hypothetical protein
VIPVPPTWSVAGRKKLSYVQLTAPETEFELLHWVCVLRNPSNTFVMTTPSEVVRLPTWSVEMPLPFVAYWYVVVTFDSGSNFESRRPNVS